LVNGVNRQAPLLWESGYSFGWTPEDDLVLVMRKTRPSEDMEREECGRDAGLPVWLCKVVGALKVIPESEYQPQLREGSERGLHGLLVQGTAREPEETDKITVMMPSLDITRERIHAARSTRPSDVPSISPALLASAGQLKWCEFRYKTTAQARRRAMMLFLCTFSSIHREAIPFVPKPLLQSTQVGAAVLRFWDVYGLTWSAGEKSSPARLRTKSLTSHLGLAPVNGREPWQAIRRQEWKGLSDTVAHSSNVKDAQEKPLSISKIAFDGSVGVSLSGLTAAGGPVPMAGGVAPKKVASSLPPIPLWPSASTTASGRTTRQTMSTASPSSPFPPPMLKERTLPIQRHEEILSGAIRHGYETARASSSRSTRRPGTSASPRPKLESLTPRWDQDLSRPMSVEARRSSSRVSWRVSTPR